MSYSSGRELKERFDTGAIFVLVPALALALAPSLLALVVALKMRG
jgi:hypothetical protein